MILAANVAPTVAAGAVLNEDVRSWALVQMADAVRTVSAIEALVVNAKSTAMLASAVVRSVELAK
jgi:hypothetical protein